ncbi:putative membrane protein [Kineosphaera limosa]|uniref:Coenzyme Q-binding protein COQ10 START domain-containing protein n=1 Tax=Kineosphaera limosa NBRC 100340 TaxID=1184609 RepID=K6XDN8_9MICO|nr:SRPBCC family protein [Kineosphaera limosa]NYD99031.1 putative membrane protein [Kineosphaera limosa]GAB96934.1 hypothetical protein KILIM_052_00320 [Kineosphaera limosa NBRC 100340]
MAQHTESAVVIEAPAEAVLDVIADLESYPTWVKGLQTVEVLTEDEGWADEARFLLDAGVIKDDYVLRYTWDVEEDSTGVVSWELVRAQNLTAMDGSYTLVAEPGGTRVTYRLAVDLRMPLPGMLRRKAERSIVETALTDLKAQVEGTTR